MDTTKKEGGESMRIRIIKRKNNDSAKEKRWLLMSVFLLDSMEQEAAH